MSSYKFSRLVHNGLLYSVHAYYVDSSQTNFRPYRRILYLHFGTLKLKYESETAQNMETRVKLIQNATTAPLMLIPDLRKFTAPSAHVPTP